MSDLIEVALPIPINHTFFYKIPEIEIKEIIGKRVIVPFGKRILTGVVVGKSDQFELTDAKPIIEVLDEHPIFDDNLLKFAKWVSEYYYTSLGEVLKSAMPPDFTIQSINNISIQRIPSDKEIYEMQMRAPKRAKLLQLIVKNEGKSSINTLQNELGTKNIAPQIQSLEEQGYIKIITSLTKMKEKTIRAIKIPTELLNDEMQLQKAFDELDKSSPKQTQLFSHIYVEQKQGKEFVLIRDILKDAKSSESPQRFSAAIIKALLEKQLIELINIPRPVNTRNIQSLHQGEVNFQLSQQQKSAFDKINESLCIKEFRTFLLDGITGSGKTLVYFHLIQSAIEIGKTALYLVPEISLTPQLIDRIEKFFPEKVAILHSKLSDRERNTYFSEINKGNYPIVLGVRSAIFAPLKDLGLIIVDEEHDASYKQEQTAPRYNARDCAIIRASIEQCPVVLGTATPSIESYYNALDGKYELLKIDERADNAVLPIIEIVDMRKKDTQEHKVKIENKYFSNELIEKIKQKIQRNEGVVLFHNRRGFAPQLYCQDCGYVPMCKNCDISLTYHKINDRLVCHYCGYSEPAPKTCGVCGSNDLHTIGAGTEKIEEELSNILKLNDVEAKIHRFDRDVSSSVISQRKILQNFINRNIDILIGTQMLSKGIDIDRITLVGIINADLNLFFPDFRSYERTFQLITQVSGRAGRKKDNPGEVIIQTHNPEKEPIKYAAEYKYEDFYNYEIIHRKFANYPPFTRFSKIEFQSFNQEEVQQKAEIFYSLIKQIISDYKINKKAIEFIGPTIPAISRIRNRYRRIIFIKDYKSLDKNGKIMRKVIDEVFKIYNEKYASNNVKVIIDIDLLSTL